MAQSNNVISMPDPSNKNSAATDGQSAGHRSPNRASVAEQLAPAGNPLSDAPSTEVYAVFGVEPEIQAYAMAKYSRSSLSMK